MNRLVTSLLGWFGWGGALGQQLSKRMRGASGSLIPVLRHCRQMARCNYHCLGLRQPDRNIIASLCCCLFTRWIKVSVSWRAVAAVANPARLAKLAHDSRGILGGAAA